MRRAATAPDARKLEQAMTCTGTKCNQGRAPERCNCSEFIQTNSDGSDPYGETRSLIDSALDAFLVLLILAVLTFVIFSALGFWSAR
jgi:hypothetical protein